MGQEIRSFARRSYDFVRGTPVVQGDEVEEFWALRDVSFEVSQGEVLGIVGRNGAGKSTLLKILSRITEPTMGRIVLWGRISSLLEVGTGFHPELTGRENIFLNGAILGMTQREIRKKFDAIVAFAEVEKFLDTMVKYYSSGMYVRLAFAVAAHLEPEILVVDEVLAVGDVEFQKKCLGKMNEVSRNEGRTVLLVSHNMEVVLKLCTRAMVLDEGRIQAIGDPKMVIPAYLHNRSSYPREIDLLNKPRAARYEGKVRLAKVVPSDIKSSWSIPFGQPLSLDISIDAHVVMNQVEVIIGLFSIRGFEVATWTNRCSNVQLQLTPGSHTLRISFQHLRLLPGQYFLELGILSDRGYYEDGVPEAVHFEVISSLEAAEVNVHNLGGAIVPSALVSVLSDSVRSSELFGG